MIPLASRLRPLALLLPLLVPAVLAGSAEAQVIWHGRSGGYDVTWSADDVSARRVSDGRPVLSLRRNAESEWRDIAALDPGGRQPEHEVRYRVLAVVGPLVSVEHLYHLRAGGFESSGVHIFTWDLSRSTLEMPATATVTDWFDDPPLVRALTADSTVRELMASVRVRELATFQAFRDTIYWGRVRRADEVWGTCSYSPSAFVRSEFAPYRADGDRLVLRFGFPGEARCSAKLLPVDVVVPVPAPLRRALADAAAGRAGFLMADAERIAAGRETVIRSGPRPSAPPASAPSFD